MQLMHKYTESRSPEKSRSPVKSVCFFLTLIPSVTDSNTVYQGFL